jgi:hypothetical protein
MKIRRAVLSTFAALMVTMAACSGGDVSVGVDIPPIPSPASPEPITSVGVVVATDPFSVNGVRYGTDNAAVAVNGRTASLSDLRVGQRVMLRGKLNVVGLTGTADTIRYDANLIGPVDAVDASLGQLVVMSQRVLIDDRTKFAAGIDPVSLDPIAVGKIVQVSGFSKSNGDLAATWIALDPGATQVQLAGKVTALDPANMLFQVDGLLVDFGNAYLIELPTGMPVAGADLIIRGNLVGSTIIADELHSIEGLLPGPPYRRINVHGYVTRFGSPSDFHVDDYPITTDWDTDYSGGSAGDVRADVEVTVDGRISADGHDILADDIALRRLLVPATTLTYDISGFRELTVSSPFDVEVTHSADYVVAITIDQDLVDDLIVTRNGTSLQLGLRPGDAQARTIEADIRLPILDRITLDGVVRARLQDFDQSALAISLNGVSLIRCSSSRFTNIAAELSGVSTMIFGNCGPSGTAHLEISEASKATVNMAVGASISGSVTGASVLQYYGTEVSIDVFTDLTSFVVRLGETQP